MISKNRLTQCIALTVLCLLPGLSAKAAVVAGRLNVVENDIGNTSASVTVTSVGQTAGFSVRSSGNSRGDFSVAFGTSNDTAMGAAMSVSRQITNDWSSVVTNGTAELQGPHVPVSAIYGTPEPSNGTVGANYTVAMTQTGTSSNEWNANAAVAWFPYQEGWLGGMAFNGNGTNGGPNNAFLGNSKLSFGTTANSSLNYQDAGGGISKINLTGLPAGNQPSASSNNGILLVNSAKNENNFALSQSNSDGTFTLYDHDAHTDGASYEQDYVSFVYVPKNACYIDPTTGQPQPLPMGRIWGDGSITLGQGPLSVTHPSTGIYRLGITGATDLNGTLMVTPEGGVSTNVDNIVSYQWNAGASAWDIATMDLNGGTTGTAGPGAGYQNLDPTTPVASFVYIPDNADVYDQPSAYGTATWSSSAGGNWFFDSFTPSSGTLRMMPNLAGNEADFLGALQTAGTINVMNQRTVGILTIDSSASYTFTGGTIDLKSATGPQLNVLSGQHTIATPLVLDTSSTISTALGSQLTVSGPISANNSGGLTKQGDGTLVLSSSANSYSGGTTINAGVLQLGSSRALPSNRSVAINSSGTLRLAGNSPSIGTFSGTGIAENASATPATLTVGGDNSNSAFTGTMQDGSGSGSFALSKAGTGTFSLGGTYAATGPVTVKAGVLQLAGGFCLPAALSVSNGSTLKIDDAGAPVTVMLGSTLTFGASNSSTSLNYQLDGTWSTSTPLLSTGDLVTSNGTTTVNIASSTVPAVGTYPLLQHSGSLTGTFVLGSLPGPRFVATLQDDTLNDQLDLVITAADRIKWQGNVSSTWDTATTPNWKLVAAGTADSFQVGDNPLFDDTAAPGSTSISIPNDVFPSGVEFNNNTLAYSISGAGRITGAASLVKSGSALLNINNDNDFSGTTTVNGGTLQFGNGGTSGSVAGNIVNNAVLAFNRSDNPIASSAISGSGSLVQNGAGVLTLAGSNTYTGLTTIGSGTLQIGNGDVTGSIAGDVLNNTALVFNRSNNLTYGGAISGPGSVTQAGFGKTVLTGSNSYSGGTTISAGTLQVGNGSTLGSITGDVVNQGTFAINRSDDLVFSGNISGNGDLVKQGPGSLTITADNSYQGNTIINGGTLVLSRTGDFSLPGVISGSGALTYQGSGTWTINSLNTITGAVTIQSGTVAFPSGDGQIGAGSVVIRPNGLLSVNATSNLGGAATLLDGGTLQQTGDNLLIKNPFTVTANGGVIDTGSFQLTYSSAVSGPAGSTITKRGSGALFLNVTQPYAGNWNIVEGSLINGNNDSESNTTFVTLSPSATFDDSFGNGENFAGLGGSGTAIILNTGSFLLVGDQTNTFSGTIRNASFDTLGDSTGGNLSKSGTGTLTLSGTGSDYGGSTAVLAGAISVAANVMQNQPGPLGSSVSPIFVGDTSGTADAAFYIAADGLTVGRDITVQSGNTGKATIGSLINSGTVHYTGAILLGTTAPKGVSIFADVGGTVEIAGGIRINGPAGVGYVVTKEGQGTMVLSSSMDAAVGMTVNSGTLSLGSTGSFGTNSIITLGSSPTTTSGVLDVTSQPGFAITSGQTLRGHGGLVNSVGPLTIQGSISPGSDSTIGTLTLNTATLDATANNVNLFFRLGATANDMLTVASPNGLAINTSGSNAAVVTLVPSSGSAGMYTLINYSGGLGGAGFAGLQLSNRVVGSLINTGSSIAVNFQQFDSPRWIGNASGDWDGVTVNWKLTNHGTATNYIDQVFPLGDSVVFDDGSDVVQTSVNMPTVVTPRSVTVNSSSMNYTFSGVGGIGGPTGLLKQGSGTLTVNTINSFTGTTTIHGGSIVVGVGGKLSSGPTTISSGGLLAVSAATSVDANSTITLDGGTVQALADLPGSTPLTVTANGGVIDTGLANQVTITTNINDPTLGSTLTKAGPGVLFLATGQGNFHGNWHVTGGTLRNGAVDGQGADTLVTVDAGATFDDSFGDGEAFGGLAGTGTAIMKTTNNFSFSTPLSTTFSGALVTALSGNFAPGTSSITQGGTGTFTLTGTDSNYGGTTTINAGAIAIGASVQPDLTSPLGSGTSAVNLGNTSGTANAAFYITSDGVQMGRDVLVRSGNTGTITVGGLNASGTAEFDGNLLLGTSGGTAKGVSLYAENGGTVDFSGGILVNGKPGAGYSVTKTGLGTVVLSGTNNYTGGTTVSEGSLIVTSAGAIADGTSLTIGDASFFASPVVPAAEASSAPAAAVPEPGTIALLLASAAAAWAARRRRAAAGR